MNITECDSKFADLERDVGVILADLDELKTLSLYAQVEKGDSYIASLQETSRSRAKQLKEWSDRLTLDAGLLIDGLEKYKRLRATVGPFNGAKLSQVLENILTGQSIVRETVEIPIEERTLLSGTQREKKVSPQELIGLMDRLFDSLKLALLSAERASDNLAIQVQDCRDEIAKLRSRCQSAGRPTTPALDALEKTVLRLLLRCKIDVFNLPSSIANTVSTPMEMARRSVEELERQLQEVDSELSKAAGTITEINLLRVRCLQAAKSLRMTLADSDVPSSRDLSDSLDSICALAKTDKLKARQILSEWQEKANSRMNSMLAQKTLLEGKLKRIDSLKERWQAARSKAEVAGYSSDNALKSFAEKIESAIQAEEYEGVQPWLKNFETRLSGLTA
jgi:hypothetical protein